MQTYSSIQYNGKPQCLVRNHAEAHAWNINVASYQINAEELTPSARQWLLGAARQINKLLEE